MFTLSEQEASFYDQNERSTGILDALLATVAPAYEKVVIESGDLIEQRSENAELYRVESGIAIQLVQGKAVNFFEPGSLLGVESFPSKGSEIRAHSKLVVQKFGFEDFFSKIERDAPLLRSWQEYLSLQLGLFAQSSTQDVLRSLAELPEIRVFEPGEAIIIQQTTPQEAFTLLWGNADVFVGEKKVGSVLRGEIFGAMASTTNTTRSASVIASDFSVVSVIPKESFLTLIETHPNALHKLISTMARVIVSQNEKIIELGGESEG